MSFLDFTLIPGGSFVMCESISEFDVNAPVEVVPPVEADEAPADAATAAPVMEDNVAARLRKKVAAGECDVVLKTLQDLGEVFDGAIVPMVNRNLEATSPEQIASVAAELDSDAEVVSAALIQILNYLRTYCQLLDNGAVRNAVVYAPIRDNLGFLIRNQQQLERDGFGKQTIYHTFHPAFESYAIRQMVNTALNAPDLIKHELLTLDTFSKLNSSDCGMCSMFSDIMDMMNTMLHTEAGAERRIRQENCNSYTYTLKEIIKWNIPMDTSNEIKQLGVGDHGTTCCNLTNMISKMLRKVKQKCYNLQVDALDGEYTIKSANECLYRCSVSIFNVFTICTMWMIACAYEAQSVQVEKKAVNEWIHSILKQYRG